MVMHVLTTTLSLPVTAAHAAQAAPPDSLEHACGTAPSVACQVAWDITHSEHAARFAKTYLTGPAQVVVRVGFVVVLALVVRYLAGRLITRISTRAANAPEGRNGRAYSLLGGERRQQRAAALGSVLRNAASMTIFTIAAFIVLGDLGLNLAPVLASAGVIGIAIGFGAQNLVQDFLAGIFMLMEDQYGVGDVITIDTVSGTVEAVSLRITRVRDVNGVIWHIRNGTIAKSGNESHGWARAVVDFPVPYNVDINEAQVLMEQAAAAMWQEDEWQGIILERPEVWGVQKVTNAYVAVRVIARTQPLRQWAVGRELRQRLMVAVSDLVAAAGSALPEPTVSTTGEDGSDDGLGDESGVESR